MYSVAQYKKNRQKIIRRAAVWYKKNTQRVKERNAARYKKDPQKVAICVTTWQQNNPKRYRQIQERAHRRRRARLANVEFDPTITLDVVYRRDDGVCQICDELVVRYEASIDHIIPVSRDGAHTWDNVQLAHRTCNRKKGANLQEAAA
jgi:5-methylcytosine-specific restriction endonuclease McrA